MTFMSTAPATSSTARWLRGSAMATTRDPSRSNTGSASWRLASSSEILLPTAGSGFCLERSTNSMPIWRARALSRARSPTRPCSRMTFQADFPERDSSTSAFSSSVCSTRPSSTRISPSSFLISISTPWSRSTSITRGPRPSKRAATRRHGVVIGAPGSQLSLGRPGAVGIPGPLDDDSEDLLNRGGSQHHLLHPVLAQGAHPLVDGDLLDGLGGRILHRQAFDLLGHDHDLVKRQSPLVAGVPARRAARRPVELGKILGRIEANLGSRELLLGGNVRL